MWKLHVGDAWRTSVFETRGRLFILRDKHKETVGSGNSKRAECGYVLFNYFSKMWESKYE